MCIKNVFYNTYGDGTQDVTERVDTCTPGEMCRRPETREYQRKFRFTKLVSPDEPESITSLSERQPTPYHADFHLRLPPTPRRSKSPSPSRKHKSGVYVNDAKLADIQTTKKRASHSSARGDRAERVVLHAPEPPAPTRLSRSSTLPVDYTVERPSRRHSREVPVGPVHILEDLGRRRRSSSRDETSHRDSHKDSHKDSHRDGRRSSSYYRRHGRESRDTSDYVYVDDERERRRALRRSNTTHGRSSDGHSSSSGSATSTRHQEPAPAPGKKLRWEDEVQAEIAAQNERISARPALHQEVKGILKKPQASKDTDVYDDLRRAISRMDIQPGSKDRSSPRRSETDDYEYDRDRLRARFGEDRRRRSRVSYGAGLYDYQ